MFQFSLLSPSLPVRSASVQVKEDNTYFLTISRSDFKRILLSVESSTIKFTELGKEVLLLEKARQGRYLVVKGTPDKMLDHLLESEIEIGSQEGDDTSATSVELCCLFSITSTHCTHRHICPGLLLDLPCIHVDQ